MKALQTILVASTLLASGAAMAQPAPYEPIPPPQVEAGPPPVAPGAGYILEPGHWQWNGVRYVWVGRHWILGRPGWTHWVPGHWRVGAFGRWHWVPGHWGP